jgi:hypothetical protein
MTNNQQPGWPQQPDNQPQDNRQQGNQQPDGTPYPPIPPAPGHEAQQPQFPPYAQQPGQQPGQAAYGTPGQQYHPGTSFMPAPPKKGVPVWGWVAGGVGVVAVIVVAGVMAFNGLESNNRPVAGPDVTASESAAPDETAGSDQLADAGSAESGAVYLFQESDFSSAPVWSVREPEGWTKEPVKEGMVNYRNASLQCTFTTYQATMKPTGGIGDEAASAQVMASEIDSVKKSVGTPVDVTDETGSTYVNLRDGSKDIELQEAELRFKNSNNADVVYRMAVRATSGNGLMELALACPGSLASEYELWLELTDRVSMVDGA